MYMSFVLKATHVGSMDPCRTFYLSKQSINFLMRPCADATPSRVQAAVGMNQVRLEAFFSDLSVDNVPFCLFCLVLMT